MNQQPKNPAAVALGRMGGQARSKAKTKAASENAKKNTGPRKSKMRLALELAYDALDINENGPRKEVATIAAIVAIKEALKLKPRKRKGTK